jgi:hypothetical protein
MPMHQLLLDAGERRSAGLASRRADRGRHPRRLAAER